MRCIIGEITERGNHMATELEWKFAATLDGFAALENGYKEVLSPIRMESTYYDTPDRRLSARRCTLRTRLENGKCICTQKTPAEKGRNEWEVEKNTIEEAAYVLCKLAEMEEPESLLPVCGAKLTRLAAALTLENATVELALDKGVFLGGGKELPLLEVEIEYKAGDEAAAKAFAFALAAEYGFTPEHKSKFRRASLLAMDNE